MNPRPLIATALALVLSTALVTPAWAQDDDEEDAPPPQSQQQEPKKDDAKKDEAKKDEEKKPEGGQEKKEEPKKDPKTAEYEKAIKDLKKIDGAFTFYQRKKDLLLELPESKLNEVFMVQAAMGTGISSIGLQAGDPIGLEEVDAFKFEKHDDQVWLIRPNFRYRWSKEDMLNLAAERSLPNAILGSFRIEQSDPEKKLLLVNVTSLFYGDLFRLSEGVSFILGGQYGLDRDKSGFENVKGFPDNSVVQMRLHYFSPRGSEGNPILEALGFGGNQLEDDRSVPMKVTYNMWFRKETGYAPRLSDPRLGYFTTDFYSLNRFLEDNRTERFIRRFNLKKKDPTAAVSEPVKPIVWTLDPSIPEKYRDAVKEGVLRWNRAFEEIGFKNAIQVQDAPKDDKDYDHADGRYNVIRWTMSPDAGYAIALMRVDPFSGEVLNASVTIDANMLAYILSDYQNATVAMSKAHQRGLEALLRNPERKEHEDAYLWKTDRERAVEHLHEGLGKLGWRAYRCEAPNGLAESAVFGWNAMQAMAAGTKINREEYAKKFLADVVSHEIGHCLGLRHNFVASTYHSTEQLANDELTGKENVAASVMDYTPVNLQAVLRGKGNFFATTVGPYDRWAVQYGYTDLKAGTPQGEKHELSKIASKSGKPGLAYMTDENADGWDPFVVRFDYAKDPLSYSAKALEAARRLRRYAITSLPKRGESYDKRTRLILSSLNRTFREGRFSARFIGGVSGARSFRGDAVERPTLAPVDPKLQRQAMSLIAQACFAPEAFQLPENVLSSLSFDPSVESLAGWNAPLRDYISSHQLLLFATLMSAGTTDRIAENSFKWGAKKGAYTMDEHFALLLGAVFKEVGATKSIAPLRRDLQRFALSALMLQAGAPQGAISEDARVVASDSIRRLVARFDAAGKDKGLDGMTRVHLRDSVDTLRRFLNRQIATPR